MPGTSPGEGAYRELVDVRCMSDRRTAIARIAFEMGYYSESRACNLEEVARVAGVSKQMVSRHLRSVEALAMGLFLLGDVDRLRVQKQALETEIRVVKDRLGEIEEQEMAAVVES